MSEQHPDHTHEEHSHPIDPAIQAYIDALVNSYMSQIAKLTSDLANAQANLAFARQAAEEAQKIAQQMQDAAREQAAEAVHDRFEKDIND